MIRGTTKTASEPKLHADSQSAIISLEDGRPYKSLKRHLAARGLTPEEYREKWGLPATYLMIAPNYSAERSALAKATGFGGKMAAKSPRRRRKA